MSAKKQFRKMTPDSTNNSLNLQYEDKVRPYIDLVDSLRALGVEKDLNLPAIAVIGDQSSGKSSVLEALSGVALPRGTGIVTRCPLVLKLKRVVNGAAWSGKMIYKGQTQNLQNPAEVGEAVSRAQNALAGNGKGISREMIALEIESCDVPDLTLIDLPGIARVATGDQPVDIEYQIKDLIEKFIKRQETISLVVVPANIDIATTEALKMANKVDPLGQRTLGILTKPDLVDKGAEETVVKTVNNEVIQLTKGYMIVKCRGQQDINDSMSLAKAQRKEKIFFEDHPHFRYLLEKGKATVSLLGKRLTKELVEHIVRSLPQLQEEIETKIEQTENDLKQLGEEVPEEDDKRNRFLIMKIKTFNEVLIDMTRGEEDTQISAPKFFSKIRAEFQQWKTLLDNKVSALGEDLDEYTRNSRGKELPGFLNYRTFEKMVKKHVQDLESPAIILLNNITGIVQSSVNSVISSHFESFPNLLRESEKLMEDLLEQERKNALMAVKSQFNMEKIVYSQDGLYSPQLGSISLQDILISDVKVMARHLNAYFKITSDRLANQLPLIIQYHMLDQYFSQFQTTMMTMIGSQNAQKLLQEDPSVARRRRNSMDRLERLVKARQALSKLVHSA